MFSKKIGTLTRSQEKDLQHCSRMPLAQYKGSFNFEASNLDYKGREDGKN